jgi:uncharacterized protein (DUF1800 family)
MKRFILLAASCFLPLLRGADPQFDKKLTKDQQIVQALNRLTFGIAPGDADQVRRIGVEKWIDLQLHPDKIAENPLLDERLKPLETLRLDMGEVLKQYVQVQSTMMVRPQFLNELLTQDQMRRVMNSTAEERQAAINALDPEKRKKVLAQIPPANLTGLPELQKEAEAARKDQQEAQQMEFRRRNPPLNDLLNQEQIVTATRGSPDQLRELFNYLDPEKRKLVAGALPPQALSAFPEMRREGLHARQPQQVVLNDLKEGKVFRAIYSNRQLEEVLVDFWFNHFNVFEGKMSVRPLIASYERDAIRPHVLGHFKDLLLATARHPAMLYYLDNWESVAPSVFDIGPFAGPPQQIFQQLQRQARGLNENYGREVMELQTLGVDGGYTQQDVINVARCFTGWTIRQPNTNPEFIFAGFMHDTAEKEVLGHKLAAGRGVEDGLEVIDILSRHPSTARFISKKLAQRFVADNPPQALIDRMSQTFLKTDGDIRAVLQAMFSSPEFFSEGAWQAKVKSPLESVISSVRALHGETIDTFTLAQKISDLGEPLYGKVEPTGYLNNSEIWLNTSSLLGRMNFATALASGQISGVKLDTSRLDGKDSAAIGHALLEHDLSPQTQEAITNSLQGKESTPRFLAGLIISSPDFQRR